MCPCDRAFAGTRWGGSGSRPGIAQGFRLAHLSPLKVAAPRHQRQDAPRQIKWDATRRDAGTGGREPDGPRVRRAGRGESGAMRWPKGMLPAAVATIIIIIGLVNAKVLVRKESRRAGEQQRTTSEATSQTRPSRYNNRATGQRPSPVDIAAARDLIAEVPVFVGSTPVAQEVRNAPLWRIAVAEPLDLHKQWLSPTNADHLETWITAEAVKHGFTVADLPGTYGQRDGGQYFILTKSLAHIAGGSEVVVSMNAEGARETLVQYDAMVGVHPIPVEVGGPGAPFMSAGTGT